MDLLSFSIGFISASLLLGPLILQLHESRHFWKSRADDWYHAYRKLANELRGMFMEQGGQSFKIQERGH